MFLPYVFRLVAAIGVLTLSHCSVSRAAVDIVARRSVADSLAEAGNLDSANVILQALATDCVSPDDTACASVFFDLGTVQFNSGQMTGADSAWRQALAGYEKIFPDHHTAVLECLRWLSATSLIRGDYGRTELLLSRIQSNWDGAAEPDPDYPVRAAIMQGVLYMNQMRLNDAEAAYEQALGLIDRYADRVTPRLAALLRNNLANLYRHQGREDEAEPLLLAQVKSLESDSSDAGEMLMAAYHNLGELYSDRCEFDRAEDYFGRALKRNRQTHGDTHPTVAFNLTSLGNLYMRAGRFEDASSCYDEALSIKRASTGLAERSVANTLVMYSHCAHALGDWDKAIDLAAESFDIRHRSFVSNSWALTEESALTYADIMRRSADACLSAIVDHPAPTESQISRAADIILRAKGQVSEAVFERQRYLSAAADSITSQLLEGYRATARRLAQVYLDGPGASDADTHRHLLDSLQTAAREFEQRLARANPQFADAVQMRHVSWTDVQQALPDEAVLIEYYRYRHRSEREDSTTGRYVALLVSKGRDPVLRDLGPASHIDSALTGLRRATSEMIPWWPGLPEEQLEKAERARRVLSESIVRPFEKLLSNVQLLLISPDADLNLLSFASLESDEGTYLIESYALHYLSAGRDLLRFGSRQAPGQGLLAIGDVDYDAVGSDRSTSGPADDNGGDRTISALRSARHLRGDLSPLPYTRREVEQVSRQWRTNYDDDVVLCLGEQATESGFRQYAPGRRAIHCATHGYFEAPADDSGQASAHAINPLLRSGLWLAGANAPRDSGATGDDGCLTAWEVLTLDLRGVEWVVLSACESGLGQVRAGEGVYGLRRAFQMAGAQSVISSLWPVSDKATSRFMTALYSHDDTDLPRRLQEVCRSELKRLREAGLPDDPVGWAAFIATGDWRLSR